MRVLVIGGAGYIGSHMVKMLCEQGVDVSIIDDLSTGHLDAVRSGIFIQGDFSDKVLLRKVLAKGFDAVFHFASFIEVADSWMNPDKYYHNNVVNTLSLLDVMIEFDVRYLVFSSTAAIFGEPVYLPIDESHPRLPINPYGRTKNIVEQALVDFDHAYGLKSVSLRYFNAAGADPDGSLGERHNPETHLIPLALQVASGRRSSINVFGRDYDTPDGTCIRDYIHVSDLCTAHWLGLLSMMSQGRSQAYNLGNGNGFSVKDVIDSVQCVTGREILVIDAPRRPGDPARLISDSKLAHEKLGWRPKYSDLETIIEHAWRWEVSNYDKIS